MGPLYDLIDINHDGENSSRVLTLRYKNHRMTI
jgi:hypothetical protein